MNTSQVESMHPVVMTDGCVTTNGGVASDWVSLKNVLRCQVHCVMTQAVGHATVLALQQATDVSGTGAKVFANVVQIWANEAIGTNDTMVAQTAAINYTVTNDIANKIVVFDVDPSLLDVANNFDCIKVTASDSSQATNFISIVGICDMKYKGVTPPSVIID